MEYMESLMQDQITNIRENEELRIENDRLRDALQDTICALEVCGKDYDYVIGKARAALAKTKGA